MALIKIVKTIWFVMFALCLASKLLTQASGESKVPCFHIFGDSLSDPGNNNLLVTLSKANFPPYGVDFPTGNSTGRFCNGRIVVDVLAKRMGFDDYIKPFTTARGKEILKGVNYASGSSGIRDETGSNLGDRFSMNRQLLNHKITVSRLTTLLGSNAAKEHLNKCLYYVEIGTEDYINNYFTPNSYTSKQFTPDQYAADLIKKYSNQLQNLYNYGARKVVLISLGQIGSTPFALAKFGANAKLLNDAAELFNNRLKPLVDGLNQNLTGANFSYINTKVVAATPSKTSTGFTVTTAPCCELGNPITCRPFDLRICPNRTQYAFFDNIHPTEAVNVLYGNGYYTANTSSSPPAAYPYNIYDLVHPISAPPPLSRSPSPLTSPSPPSPSPSPSLPPSTSPSLPPSLPPSPSLSPLPSSI